MPALLERVSTITSKGQTTVPKEVRDALGIAEGDKIKFSLDSDKRVLVSRADEMDSDPVFDAFLTFLANDLGRNPSGIRDIPESLMKRVAALTAGMRVDLDEAIDGDVAL